MHVTLLCVHVTLLCVHVCDVVCIQQTTVSHALSVVNFEIIGNLFSFGNEL